MRNDVWHALRRLRGNLGFTLTAIITLAVGIGATTGVYSIYNAVLVRPLPFQQPERIVDVRIATAKGGSFGISGGVLPAVRALHAIDRAAAVIATEQTLLTGGDPELLRGAAVTSEFFTVFGVPAFVGRTFRVDSVDDESPIVLSYRLWQRRFGADAGILGRPLRVGTAVRTVVGVMPASFKYPDDAEFWVPNVISPDHLARLGPGPFNAVARLKASDIAAASAQADSLRGPLAASREGEALHVLFVPLIESMAGLYRSYLDLLLTAVTMVLLISCLNVANLLLAQTTAREQELAIRGAIGATRWHLLRQLVAESLILGTGGAAVGLGLAKLILISLPLLGTLDIPRLDEATLDWRVLVFAIIAATASVAIFGIAPPWLSIRRLTPSLRPGRNVAGHSRRRASHVLIAIQVAATLALLVGSALVLTSLYRQHKIEFGFETADLTVTTFRAPPEGLKRLGGINLHERILEQLREDSALDSVAAMSHVPLEEVLAPPVSVTTAQGLVVPQGRSAPRLRVVSPGAFETLRVPIVNGRTSHGLTARAPRSCESSTKPSREPFGGVGLP